MDTPPPDSVSVDAREDAPLIDFAQDVALDERPDFDIPTNDAQPPPVTQEPITPQKEPSLDATPSPEALLCPYPGSAPYTPGRSIRELVESLGSPVCSDPISPRVNTTPRTSPPLRLPSPSPFDDPFGDHDFSDSSSIPRTTSSFRTTDTASFIPLNHSQTSMDFLPTSSNEHERSFGQDLTSALNIPDEAPPTPCPALTQASIPLQRPIVPSWLTPRPSSPRPESPIPYAVSSPRFTRPTPRPARRLPITPIPAHVPTPTYPWSGLEQDPFNRPDRFSRTTAHTTISDILFNFDLDPASAAELIEDACETARQVGVSTHDLLSRSVFLGMSDLGMSPLCLEASRVDLENGMELVLWLIENTRPSEAEREVKLGCLMRRNGMGEQTVWNVLRGFLPDVDGQTGLAYDVEVEGLAVVPGGAGQVQGTCGTSEATLIEDSDDDGSLYDVSIIDAESGFLDQADIETLKSSEDELDKGKERERDQVSEPVPSRVHRARIVMPTFKESLTGPSWAYTSPSTSNRYGMASSGRIGDKLLTAEWMFEGRLWALSVGEDSLILTLRQTSALVSEDVIKIKALVRLLPLDLQWTQIKEIDRIGPDGLLPTQTPSDVLLSSPLYECEFEEKEVVPGPIKVGMNSSVWKTDIRVSLFTLLELVGPQNGIKLEVVVRVTEKDKVVADICDMDVQCEAGPSTCASSSACVSDRPGTSVADESDWQFIDD